MLLLLTAAGGWLAWRFLPRDWLAGCCAGPPDGDRLGRGAATEPHAGATASEGRAGSRGPDSTDTSQPLICVAVTRSGGRCSREVEAGSIYCWQHASS